MSSCGSNTHIIHGSNIVREPSMGRVRLGRVLDKPSKISQNLPYRRRRSTLQSWSFARDPSNPTTVELLYSRRARISACSSLSCWAPCGRRCGASDRRRRLRAVTGAAYYRGRANVARRHSYTPRRSIHTTR